MASATVHSLDTMDDYIQTKSINKNNYDVNDVIFETDPVAFGVTVDFGPEGLQLCCQFGQCYDLSKFDDIVPFDDPARRSFPKLNKLDKYSAFPEKNPMLMVNPRTLEPNRCWCPQTSSGKVINKHCGLHPRISYNSLHSKAYFTNATQRHREVLGSNARIVSISHHSEDLKTSEHLVHPSTQESNHTQKFKSLNKKISQKSLLKRNNIGNEIKPPFNLKSEEKENNDFPKPPYSFSNLLVLAIKNSLTGKLTVTEIYAFIEENFPYYKNAPAGWKNSIRHNLSLSKAFEKFENPASEGNRKKGVLWGMVQSKLGKLNDELEKAARKDVHGIKKAMQYPDILLALQCGEMKKSYKSVAMKNSEDEDPWTSPASGSSGSPPHVPPAISKLEPHSIHSNFNSQPSLSEGSQGYNSAGSDFVDQNRTFDEDGIPIFSIRNL